MMLRKIGRALALVFAVLVIVLSLGGIAGAWWANSTITNITVQAFAIVDTGVNIVDTGVGRVDQLVQTGRTEVQQTADTIVSVADELRANRPILTALSERVEARLGPTVDQIRDALTPVRESLTAVANIVSLLNSIPFMNERAPRLDALDQTFERLAALAADIQQLRTTLREAALSEADRMTQQAVDVLTGVTTRIDDRLAETQANIQQVQADIQALRDRLDAQERRLLLIYDLAALGTTLLLLWIIYSQVVVMRHHWRLLRAPATAQVSGGSASGITTSVAPATVSVTPPTASASVPAAIAAVDAEPEPPPAAVSEAVPAESPGSIAEPVASVTDIETEPADTLAEIEPPKPSTTE